MSDKTEDLLRVGMDRFTSDMDAPYGLAIKAARHRQRRRVANRATAVAAVATAAGLAVALVVATAPAPVATTGVQTTAYVITHAEAALAQATSQNRIQYVHQASSGGIFLSLGDVDLSHSGALWVYQDQARTVTYGPDGRLAGEEGEELHGLRLTTTLVNHQNRSWWRMTQTLPPIPTRKLSCQTASEVSEDGAPGLDWATLLRLALRCGQYTTAGTQRIDGVRALELKPAQQQAWPATIWVDPSSYLPVRQLVTFHSGTVQNDFRWLRPTQANLANLEIAVPPGYTETKAPYGPILGKR